jgi:LacI family transcriptional regulator
MLPRRRATLGDVCERAGVSVYTASRALAGHDDISASTKERVREAAAELGYVANLHARSLKGGASKVIGIIAASKANQYYATLVSAFESAVEPFGYSCFVADAAANGVYLEEREDRIVTSMIQQRVAAIVLTCAISAKNLELLKAWSIPVLFVDCLPPETGRDYPCVTSDNFAASRALGEHFAALGYRRWVFIGHAPNWNTRPPRQQGFEAAAADCGASVQIAEGGNDAEVARRALMLVLTGAAVDRRSQAIFASNTVLLKGVLLALKELGLRAPHQIAVAAFDDFDWAELVDPPITVVDQRIQEIGRTAGAQAIRLVGGEGAEGAFAHRTIIPPQLKVRASCGAMLLRSDRPGLA